MRYAYYPGCSLHSSGKEFGISTEAICEELGIELEEIPGWVCCGASSAHMTSELLGVALPARNLLAAKGLGAEVLACCAACYSRLRVANSRLSGGASDTFVAHVDDVVGEVYRGEVKVKHLLEVIRDDFGLDALRSRVTKGLDGLTVACYYGCLLVRPPAVVGFDDPENPTSMDDIVAALGAEPVSWSHKVDCCGGSLSLTRTDVVLKLCRDILQAAADAGADCVAVGCPLCHASLDLRQSQVNKHYGLDLDLPVLYISQLIGLALGIEPRKLAMQNLIVAPDKLLKAKALA